MDEYAFLIELNSNLGFKFAGNAIAGDIEDISFKISFALNNSLKVHTKVYLDSSYPTEEHVIKALEKTGSFPKHDLEYENIDLFVPQDKLSMDSTLTIAQDILTFANELKALGYKSSNSQISVSNAYSTLQGDYDNNEDYDVVDDLKHTLFVYSKRVWFGLIGAVVGGLILLGLFAVAGMSNALIFFLIAALINSFLPVLLYEIAARERICLIGVVVCLLFSVFNIFAGDRIMWSLNYITWYDNIKTYTTEEPVQTETARELDPPGANVEKTPEYYRDFIIMFSFLGFVYIFVVLNFLFGKFTVVDLVKVMSS
jgi:hypothetical protein